MLHCTSGFLLRLLFCLTLFTGTSLALSRLHNTLVLGLLPPMGLDKGTLSHC